MVDAIHRGVLAGAPTEPDPVFGVHVVTEVPGVPNEILTDNGSQYVTWRGTSQFTKELRKLGIGHLVAKPRRPQTLGKIDDRNGWLAQVAGEFDVRFQPQVTNTQGRVSPQAAKRLREQVKRTKEQIARFRKQGNDKRAAQLQKNLVKLRQRYGGNIVKDGAVGGEEVAGPAVSEEQADRIVRQAYLRTLSRPPSGEEREVAISHVREAKDVVSGTRDLLWALLNTKEFIVNH